ncbi:MAG: photosynthetic complex assembly protein PuhC [Steroidobacteraceae bacterium]
MSNPFADRPIPRFMTLSSLALVVTALALAGLGRLTGVGTTTSVVSAPPESRAQRFEDGANGSIVVLEQADTLTVIEPGRDGFIRGALRGLARERRLRGIGPEVPFELTRWSDGRFSLTDPATGQTIDLAAFGADNLAAFASLLTLPIRSAQLGPESP